MLTQVTSVVLAFVQGLVVDPEGKDAEEEFDFAGLIKPYSKELL